MKQTDEKLYQTTIDIADPKRATEYDFASKLGLDSYVAPDDLNTRRGDRLLNLRNAAASARPAISAYTPMQTVAMPEIDAEPIRVVRTVEENMPSILTLEQIRALQQKTPTEIEQEKKTYEKRLLNSYELYKGTAKIVPQSKRLTKNAKLVITLYVAIALVLAAAILISGIVMSNLNNNVSALEAEQRQKYTTLSELERELILLENNDVLVGKATKIGFEDVGNSFVELELIEIGEAQSYDMPTNWFDRLCSFFSGLSGG